MRIQPLFLTVFTFVVCAATACHSQKDQNASPFRSHPALGAVSNPLSSESAAVMNIGRRDRLTVLTFNMQHRNNPQELGVMAERLDIDLAETPDFILCQEVLFERSREEEESNTAAVLANDLGCHWRGTKRTSDREGVAIISRYPFAYYDELHLKSQTSRMLLGFRRVSVMGEFNVPDVGLVRVVNVHFTNWGFEARVRQNQLEETLAWLAERDAHVPADLIVFGGDFNIKFGDDEMTTLTEGKFAQRFEFQDFNTNNPTRGKPGKPKHRVDYIFISAPQTELRMVGRGEQRLWLNGLTSSNRRGRFWLSDHVPVLHEYALLNAESIALANE